ncbi:MAG TPA: Ig-like domain-containing protein, partial [Kiritimatiellia bacterium]|nr:Ig-like domain-containing protein [Kiritimatiellia bacterium]
MPECIVYSIAARGDTLYAAGRFGKAWVDETNSIATANIAQARWSESQQSWSWSDLDLGIYHYWSDPGFTGFGLSTAIIEGSQPGAYDLIVGGSFRQAGTAVFLYDPPSPDPNCLARWRIGDQPGSRPSVSVIEPAANAVFTNVSTVELFATASSYTNIASAWFVIDDQPAMQAWPVSNDVYNVYWYDPSPGVHQVRAVAVNADEIRGDSRPVLVTVKSSTNTVYASDDQYSLLEGGGAIALPVLSNDVSSTAFRISRVTQPQGPLGRALVGYDGSFVSYMPFERRHGTERFYYTITNSLGDSDSAWVMVNLLSRPEVWIDSPWDGQRLGVSSAVTVSGSSHSHDWERPVTNVTLLVNGSSFAQTTNTANFSFAWSNSAPGFYTFEAVATDAAGVSNRSPWVTIALTNGAVGQLPVAKIMNLKGGLTQLSSVAIESPP